MNDPFSVGIRLLHRYWDQRRVLAQQEKMCYLYDAVWQDLPKPEILNKIGFSLPEEAYKILNYVYDIRPNLPNMSPLNVSDIKVSVIIPHYNQHSYLDQALYYLTKQSVLPDEIIVVDDRSENFNSVKNICNKYQKKLNLRLIRPAKKLYAGGAKQLGVEKAHCEIVVIHDADDISQRSRIKLTKAFFKKFPQACQLNVGYVEFPKDHFLDYIQDFDDLDLTQYVHDCDSIKKVMRRKFCQQLFSTFRSYGSRLGGYGENDGYGFGAQTGHVAYRKILASLIKWPTPWRYTFTKFEDYDFNFMLFLITQKSYQLDLPLVYYRRGTSTNLVDY
ncbi:glycosyltransferase family 2 protein [Patescibacteria group bacterium]|nr:glycosyltransferase family 2 protein [Patescibacteria group bacterium]